MVASTKKTIQTDGTSDTTTTITSTITASKMNSLITNICSMSFGSTMFMALFTIFSFMNIYRMMYPLSAYDLSKFGDETNFVKPLWDTASDMHIRVYLSTKSTFDIRFFHSDYFPSSENDDDSSSASGVTKNGGKNKKNRNHKLLWDDKLSSPAFSKSFLLTSCNETSDVCQQIDESYRVATERLDQAERIAIERGEGGVLSALSAAGHGVESTSALLTLYQWFTDQIQFAVGFLLGKHNAHTVVDPKSKHGILERTVVNIPSDSPMWQSLHSNSTLYLHVLLVRTDGRGNSIRWPPMSFDEASDVVQKAIRSGSLIMGKVNMIKHEQPHHIDKPRRILFNDLIYLYNKHVKYSREMPPWVYAISKPEQNAAYEQSVDMKKRGAGYPYWKPEVSIKYVNDDSHYPVQLATLSGMKAVSIKQNPDHPTGFALMPTMHVDEMGMTSEKYIPVNETVTCLPLRITFDRSDLEDHTVHRSTATAGGMSPARWRLLLHLSESIEKQKELGFEQSDIDDIKRLIADTNILLLAITFFASSMHLLFEFLTFKNEISFWNNNNDLTGLSVRSLFLDMIGQIVIFLFLIEERSSLLTIIPCGIGCLIALWKCQRGAGLKFVRLDKKKSAISWWNFIPSLFGYDLRATRLEVAQNTTNKPADLAQVKKDQLIAMTLEADRIATRYLGAAILPFVAGYTIYSFVYKEHTGWYSWIVTTAASAVYALGFVLMTPQLFLNWKLKSVAHLPWRVLVYKSLNTFIDDLFSFIIRMPTMARISCFRDDVVFFIYLYQRWLYPVDTSRPIEGGGDGTEQQDSSTNDVKKKKDQ